MGNDDRVLSQAEIDALLSSSITPAPPKPAAAAPVQQVKVAAAPPPPKVAAQAPKAAAAPPPPPATKAAVAPAAPAPVKAAAPPPAPAPAPQIVQQGPTPEQVKNLCRQIVAEQTKDLAKQVVELTIKVNKIDNIKQRIDQIEEKIGEIADVMQSSPEAINALGARMEELYNLMAGMRKQHNKTDEEHIHDQFRCVDCHSEKLVAIHVKCTNCGKQNWMGWFPDSQQPGSSGESASSRESGADIQEHY